MHYWMFYNCTLLWFQQCLVYCIGGYNCIHTGLIGCSLIVKDEGRAFDNE